MLPSDILVTQGMGTGDLTVQTFSSERLLCLEAMAYRGGVWGIQTPPEIPKAFQNRAKLNPTVKTVKNC